MFPRSLWTFALCLVSLLVLAAAPPAPTPPVVISLDPTGVNRALALAYAPDGRSVAVGTATGLGLYDAQSGAELRFIASASWVRSVAFAPDGQTVAAGYYAPEVKLWRVSDGALVRTLTGHTSWVRSLAFSPDGQTLLTASDDQSVRWWRVSDGASLHTLTTGMVGVRVLALSPDGATLATGGADHLVHLVDARDGAPLRTLAGHTDWVRSLAFSPDGRTLASGAFDATARLWRVSDGAPLAELRGHTFSVLGVAFSPDGRTLATGSVDARIVLWRVADGVRLRVLQGHTGFVFALAFSPDGRTLASAAADNTARLWPVNPDEPPQTDNVPVVPSTSCVECHHPGGDYMQPGGLTNTPPVLDVACAACHEGGTLVLHWCPAFQQAPGVSERRTSLATLADHVGYPSAARDFALLLAAPGNGEHYYVPDYHTVVPVSGRLYGADPAGITVTLQVWSGGRLTGQSSALSDATGWFFINTDLRPDGLVLDVPIEQRSCVLCHSDTLSDDPALPPGPVKLVVSAAGPRGQVVSDVRWITIDHSRHSTAPVQVVTTSGDPAPAGLTVQAAGRLYGWRGRQSTSQTDAAGQAALSLETLSEVSVDYVFSLPPTVVDGRLFVGAAAVTVTVPARAEVLPVVTLTVTTQTGQVTGQIAGAGGIPVYLVRVPDGLRLAATTDAGGAFVFAAVPPARYQVLADPEALAALGRISAAQTIDLTSEAQASVTLNSLPLGAGAFRGAVLDDQGHWLPFAWVSIGVAGNTAAVSPDTAAWVLRGVPSDARSVVAGAPGYYSSALPAAPDATEPIEFRLQPRPDLRRLPWGSGALQLPADAQAAVDGLHLTLEAGWLWGQGGGPEPLVVTAAGVVVTLPEGQFALGSRPGQSPWLYLLAGRAEAYRVGRPEAVVALAAPAMLFLAPSGPLTPLPLDSLAAAALQPAAAVPEPAWAPSLSAQFANRLGLLGISAAQMVTLITYLVVLTTLVALPVVRLSWWLRKRRDARRPAHV
ncbi:MAG: WD40 repeat domain-containing protein [Anaerolineales bacterium]|nr:WD40 repeat domain-containing protein [Anaerolineales bacterium]